jgi:ATP-binding cassette subfamily B protein
MEAGTPIGVDEPPRGVLGGFDRDTEPTPYEPVGVAPRYPAPTATIDPDQSKGWIRRVLPVVRSHRTLLVVSLLAASVAIVTQVAVPAVTRQAIDVALIDKTGPVSTYVAILVALALVRAISAYAYRYGLYRLALLAEADLRSLLFGHLTRLSFSFYDRVQSGQIISRANSDIRSVQLFLAFAPLMGMTFVSFALALAVMLTISVPLTLVAVLPLPGVYVVGVMLRNKVFPLSWISQARQADVATIVEENVAGVRVVKGFAAEEQQIDHLARAALSLKWANVVTADTRASHTPFIENLPRLGQAAVLVVGGWLAIEGSVTVGTLVAFNAYIVQLQVPFRLLGLFLMMMQRAAASAERIYEILDEPAAITDRPGAVDLIEPEGRVEFRDVGFAYGKASAAESGNKTAVLDGFSLTIEPGETVAVVGRTGSGKSTLARLLPRFYDVDGGQVLVDGHDVRDLTVTSLRSEIGLVLDEPFLFSTSVRDNIAYGRPDADLETVVAAATAAQAHDFISALPDGYDTVIGERGYTLSGGQRQRIAIARTLVVNPRMLVLDDATSAIDVQVEQEIHAALENLLDSRTTLVIAHRLSTIGLADRVVLLEGGRVVAQGTHDHLLATEPRYREVLAHTDDTAGTEAPAAADADGEGGEAQ